MIVINRQILNELVKKHADVKNPVDRWLTTVNQVVWSSFNDVKQTFSSADYVGNKRFVFNLKGNNYRIIAIINFTLEYIIINWAGTHNEYNKISDCSLV
jgi:mRNA interferase HigB